MTTSWIRPSIILVLFSASAVTGFLGSFWAVEPPLGLPIAAQRGGSSLSARCFGPLSLQMSRGPVGLALFVWSRPLPWLTVCLFHLRSRPLPWLTVCLFHPQRISSEDRVISKLSEVKSLISTRLHSKEKTKDVQGPDHLIVLVHGLAGTVEDLSYLKRALERISSERSKASAVSGRSYLVHLAGTPPSVRNRPSQPATFSSA